MKQNSDDFQSLLFSLSVHPDEFLRTSADPRHRTGVDAIWRRIADKGDFYTQTYEGLYCQGCEQFYTTEELVDGVCFEHKTAPQVVSETNYFFRLSKYHEQVRALIETDVLCIRPQARRNEVLSFLKETSRDLSVSRPVSRSGGWGLTVPGDESQTIYVWIDALANYITGLDFDADDELFQKWWSDAEITHVVGKGIVRFHAVYWPAILLAADLPLPNNIFVHDYLTVNGEKISKTGNAGANPQDLLEKYGVDAVRWWLLSEPSNLVSTDFTVERLVERYNQDLANSIGNLASRVVKLSHLDEAWRSKHFTLNSEIASAVEEANKIFAAAFIAYDFRSACQAIVSLSQVGNRWIGEVEPWLLAKRADGGDSAAADEFEHCIGSLLYLCTQIGELLAPLLPNGAQRLDNLLEAKGAATVFPRLA